MKEENLLHRHAAFGKRVCEIMEAHEDWNADFAESLSFAAEVRGLRVDDHDGNFKYRYQGVDIYDVPETVTLHDPFKTEPVSVAVKYTPNGKPKIEDYDRMRVLEDGTLHLMRLKEPLVELYVIAGKWVSAEYVDA